MRHIWPLAMPKMPSRCVTDPGSFQEVNAVKVEKGHFKKQEVKVRDVNLAV